MKIFEKHKCDYKKIEGTMYCDCGKHFNYKCNHDWVINNTKRIKTIAHTTHEVTNLTCKKCGVLAQRNLTSGTVEYSE